MPRFAANLSMMFNEWEFLDRFKAASEAGFEAVEFLFPYEHAPEKVGLALAGGELNHDRGGGAVRCPAPSCRWQLHPGLRPPAQTRIANGPPTAP